MAFDLHDDAAVNRMRCPNIQSRALRIAVLVRSVSLAKRWKDSLRKTRVAGWQGHKQS